MSKSVFARLVAALVLITIASAATSARAQIVVYNMISDNGFFTPFNQGNFAGIKYGDSGWFGSGSDPSENLTQLTLRLATFGSAAPGLTDLKITINDGDPSGFVFGTGSTLYTTLVTNVVLPAQPSPGAPAYFDVVIPLPSVATTGGFNNVGFSVECQNFNFVGGQFGFQCTSASGAIQGFYTNNASYYNGGFWSLFSFGANPNTGIAQFSAVFETPAPGAAALLALGGLAASRRRR